VNLEHGHDGELMEASKGAPGEFAPIFDRHYLAIHRYISHRVGDSLADDLTAETFCTALRERGRYDQSYSDARPWLFGIASNLIRRHFRTEARRLNAYARFGVDPDTYDSDAVDRRVDASSLVSALAAALTGLSPADRETMLLYAWADLSYEEISKALGIPIGTVRSRISRARALLGELLPVDEPNKPRPMERSGG
jgi:RNA polymerase sigma factor (sigma-70 family)